MPEQLKLIVAFCPRRYNENRHTHPGLAKAHLSIINRANDVMLSTGIPGDLLDFLSKPQLNPDLARGAVTVHKADLMEYAARGVPVPLVTKAIVHHRLAAVLLTKAVAFYVVTGRFVWTLNGLIQWMEMSPNNLAGVP